MGRILIKVLGSGVSSENSGWPDHLAMGVVPAAGTDPLNSIADLFIVEKEGLQKSVESV